MSEYKTRALYLRDDSKKGSVSSYVTPSAYKYKQVTIIKEDETGVTLDIITPGLNNREIHATYDEFRALDLYVRYRDGGKYTDTLPITSDRDSKLIEEVKKNKVSYIKYFEYLDNKINHTNETAEILETKEKIKNMTDLLKVEHNTTTPITGGKVKSRRKIKSKKNSKSCKGKSHKGKSHKGNSKKTRRKSNRRSR